MWGAARMNRLGSDKSSFLIRTADIRETMRCPVPYYYVNLNEQPHDGYHEVHIDAGSCPHPPLLQNRHNLGYHQNCRDAVQAAKGIFPKSDGCYYCLPLCHTR